MYIVVGLGNPNKSYKLNRHNIGFMAVDEIFYRYNFAQYKEKFDGLFTKGKIGKNDVVLLKPGTYMNLSGNSVQKACQFFKVKPENVIVLYDDLDLDFAKVKIKFAGGAGGHNGIKSIDKNIGSQYKRVRIGIGRPQNNNKAVASYVLDDFNKDEQVAIKNKLLPNLANYLPLLLNGDDSEFMNKLYLN